MSEAEAVKAIRRRYKKLYCRRKKWAEYTTWKPQDHYRIMQELRTLHAVDLLTGNGSWTEWYRPRVKKGKK